MEYFNVSHMPTENGDRGDRVVEGDMFTIQSGRVQVQIYSDQESLVTSVSDLTLNVEKPNRGQGKWVSFPVPYSFL